MKMKILSIDFDYFMDISRNNLFMCPDGIDLPQETTCLTWGSRYATAKMNGINMDEIIKFDNEGFDLVMDKIMEDYRDIPVLICNSHIHIYDFIINMYDRENDTLEIFHIDQHSDVGSTEVALDCGNWVSYIKADVPEVKIHWISKKELYDEDIHNMIMPLDIIEGITFDAIFLCKSATWLYPRFDCYFEEMACALFDNYNNVICSSQIEKSREKTFEQVIIEQEKVLKEFKDYLKREEKEKS